MRFCRPRSCGLRIPRSSAAPQPINSVKHAIAMVGVSSMRKFALGASISNLFSRFRTAPSFSMARFNLHSVATGTLVELISDEIDFDDSNGAFIAGLLHDVGKLLIAVSMPKQYEDILARRCGQRRLPLDCEREILGTDHAELSGLAISRWELAEPIRWAACYHHEPDRAAELERTGPGKLSLTWRFIKPTRSSTAWECRCFPCQPRERRGSIARLSGFSSL